MMAPDQEPRSVYAIQRTLRTIELLSFEPASLKQIAASLGIHPKTCRGLLRTLIAERYVERHRRGKQHVYTSSLRLFALAAQLANHSQLVTTALPVVEQLHQRTGQATYVAMPSYKNMLVLAHAGHGGPRAWSLLPVTESAVGHALLTYRSEWRKDLGAQLGNTVDAVRTNGYASTTHKQTTSLATAVFWAAEPLVAIGLDGATAHVMSTRQRLTRELHRSAECLAESMATRSSSSGDPWRGLR